MNLSAQDKEGENQSTEQTYLNNDWKWAIELPIWIPGFRGDFAYGDISIEAEDGIDPGTPANPIEPPPPGEPPVGGGSILSRLFNSSKYLKFFYIGRASYQQDKFLVQTDFVTGTVGESLDFVLNKKEVATASYATIIGRLIFGYSFYELENKSKTNLLRIHGYTGGRVHYFELFSNLNLTNRNLDINKFWGEVVLGLQARFVLKDWLFWLQADIGSFYTSNNSSYMINTFIYYRISNLLSVKIGWTDWDVSYQGEILNEKLSLNVHLSGPNTGLAFHF
ncbi:MAG: hypothetical protein JSW63_12390 [Ignavibacterium sp.]|nr:MAG: hypothetical protein JSW63_12390 [Ignavibacterium sp.]